MLRTLKRATTIILAVLTAITIQSGVAAGAGSQGSGTLLRVERHELIELVANSGIDVTDPVANDSLESLSQATLLDVQRQLAELPTASGKTLGEEVRTRLRKVSAAGTTSDSVERFLHSIVLRDGARLVDVVPPALLYRRSSTTTERAADDEVRTSFGGFCGGWVRFIETRIDSDNYLVYWHGWAKTEHFRRCALQPSIVVQEPADTIHAKVYPTYSNASGWDCWVPLDEKGTSRTKTDEHTVSVSRDAVRRWWWSGEAKSFHRAVDAGVENWAQMCTE